MKGIHRVSPFAARLRAKLRGNRGIYDGKAVEIAPGVLREQAAATCLPGEFDRVISIADGTTREIELARLGPAMGRHGPTMAYPLERAVVSDGCVYFSGGYQVFRPGKAAIVRPKMTQHAEAMLCTNPVVEKYFGHWVQDGLLQELAAEQRGLPALTTSRIQWLHEPSFRDVMGLWAKPVDHAEVERLWVLNDMGLNDYWVARFDELRRRMRTAAGPHGPKRVVVRRGVLGASRALVNEQEIEGVLQKMGFESLAPELESAHSIATKLAHAEIAILVEGSAIHHCLLAMPRGSTIVVIQPPRRFNAITNTYASPVGIRWAYAVADDAPEGFRMPPDRLQRLLDLIA